MRHWFCCQLVSHRGEALIRCSRGIMEEDEERGRWDVKAFGKLKLRLRFSCIGTGKMNDWFLHMCVMYVSSSNPCSISWDILVWTEAVTDCCCHCWSHSASVVKNNNKNDQLLFGPKKTTYAVSVTSPSLCSCPSSSLGRVIMAHHTISTDSQQLLLGPGRPRLALYND